MAKVIDLVGQTFARWTVKEFSHQVGKMSYWKCLCECGIERAVFGGDLKRGGSLSCGCLARERRAIRMTKHGMSGHPAYCSWQSLDQRCNNPKNDNYYRYGGRGITVCDSWKNNFAAFWRDMGPTWQNGLSIDRIDPDGNYEPTNCKWSTPKEQANNRRSNHIIQTEKGPMTIMEAAEFSGLSPFSIISRIQNGWSEENLLKPIRPHK